MLRCRVHLLAFTLYPPGYVPYGRKAVATVTLVGAELDTRPEAPAETLLDAARDAAQGQAWHREHPGGSATWWSTQGRQVAVAVQIFGVAPDLDLAARLLQAAALQVCVLALVDAAQTIAEMPGYRTRGRAAMGVLDRMPRGPCRLQCLLAAGHLAGRWGPPWRWDADAHQLRQWAFLADRTRPP